MKLTPSAHYAGRFDLSHEHGKILALTREDLEELAGVIEQTLGAPITITSTED
ncbi:MAG: hypothetical protein ACXVYB_00120 [Arthrobacter sp.]